MGEYFLWYVATVVISFVIAVITGYNEHKTGKDITLKGVTVVALAIFTPVVNSALLILLAVVLGVVVLNEVFDWLGEKFDTVVLFKGKGK